MANQCVTELEVIGPEEVIRQTLFLMIANLKDNGIAEDEPPAEDSRFLDITRWLSKYTGSPTCAYLEALSTDVSANPMGWDARVSVLGYGELFRLRMDFDTAWGPASSEVESFIEALPSPCGVYYRPNTDYRYKELLFKKEGEVEKVKLSTSFNRFKKFEGDFDVFRAQMHKMITNRLPKIK